MSITSRHRSTPEHTWGTAEPETRSAPHGGGLYGAFFESATVPLMVVDLTTLHIAEANPAFQRLLGYDLEELRRLPYTDLTHPNDLPAHAGFVLAAHPDGDDTGQTEKRYIRKDGRAVWVRKNVSIARDHGGDPILAFCIAADITAEREAQLAHRTADDRYRRIVETTTEGIWVLDPAGRTSFVNEAMAHMLDLSPAELEGRSVFEFCDTGLGTRADQVLSRRLDGVGEQLEVTLRRADRTEIRVLFTTNSIFDEGGAYAGALVMVTDMTSSGEQQTYLRGLEAQLRESQRLESIGQLAGGIAHDFNNLLLGIRGYGELALIRLERGEDSAAADIRDMLAAAERATHLTRQLLAFGRRQILHASVLDLNEVVHDLENLLRQLTGDHIALTTVCPKSPVLVDVDRTELERVIANLAVNAREAMPDGGSLVVEVRESIDTHEGVLVVTDTGSGMDAETANRIFEPFFSTKGVAGTGFGLATVHGIVNQSGGRIVLESTLGEGTTFTIFFPTSTDTEHPEHPPAERVSAAGGAETILVAEDDAMVRTIVTSMLENLGYEVIVATSGDEACELAEAWGASIDLLLTDLVMPGIDGRVTAETVRGLFPDVKVLYMSGYAHDVVIRGGPAFELGSAFIQKPFGAQELAERVREVIETVPA